MNKHQAWEYALCCHTASSKLSMKEDEGLSTVNIPKKE